MFGKLQKSIYAFIVLITFSGLGSAFSTFLMANQTANKEIVQSNLSVLDASTIATDVDLIESGLEDDSEPDPKQDLFLTQNFKFSYLFLVSRNLFLIGMPMRDLIPKSKIHPPPKVIS